MIRPGFIALPEAPITAAERGSRRFFTFSMRRRRGRVDTAVESSDPVEGDRVTARNGGHRIHLDLIEHEGGRAPLDAEGHGQIRQRAERAPETGRIDGRLLVQP